MNERSHPVLPTTHIGEVYTRMCIETALRSIRKRYSKNNEEYESFDDDGAD